MTDKTYIMTTGDYEGYTILAVLRGKSEPDMKTLVNECYAEFGFNVLHEDVELRKHVNWEKRHKLEIELLSKACAAMRFDPNCDNVDSFLIAWLKARHGFVAVPETDTEEYRI